MAKKTQKELLVVTKLYNTAVTDLDARISVRCYRMLVVIKVTASGTQCMFFTDQCILMQYLHS